MSTQTIKTILAVDDEPSMLRLLEISLRQAGYKPLTAKDGQEALALMKMHTVDCVVTDLHMPRMTGLQLLEAIRLDNSALPVIIVTAQGEIQSAIAAMKAGASDYILRPFDLEVLEIAITRALTFARLRIENQFLREEQRATVTENAPQHGLIGQSTAMQKVHAAITQVAPEKATVLIAGETGTGKELVARAIHAGSPRNEALFVAVNCAAIPHEMLESELFGHEKGAFTGALKDRIGKFELADGGTLFLDEITEMPMQLQAKLLRALQESVIERLGGNRPIKVDIRVVAATNRDPMQAIKEGKLREDLYYRLNVFRIDLPALNARAGDVAVLTKHFLGKQLLAIKAPHITDDALHALNQYTWPGNVRELENVLERAMIVSGKTTITTTHLPVEIVMHQAPFDAAEAAVETESAETLNDKNAGLNPSTKGTVTNSTAMDMPNAVSALEKRMMMEALAQTNGNKSRAAKVLQISERSLWYKLELYGLK